MDCACTLLSLELSGRKSPYPHHRRELNPSEDFPDDLLRRYHSLSMVSEPVGGLQLMICEMLTNFMLILPIIVLCSSSINFLEIIQVQIILVWLRNFDSLIK